MATIQSRVSVCHVLQSVYVLDVVEQIVSVAERNNLSAIDSVEVVRAQTGDKTLVVMPRRVVTEEKPLRQAKQAAPKQTKETRLAYATHSVKPMYANATQLHVFADCVTIEPVISRHAQNNIFVTVAHNNL